jgi:hypothetical protein
VQTVLASVASANPRGGLAMLQEAHSTRISGWFWSKSSGSSAVVGVQKAEAVSWTVLAKKTELITVFWEELSCDINKLVASHDITIHKKRNVVKKTRITIHDIKVENKLTTCFGSPSSSHVTRNIFSRMISQDTTHHY